jgi:hypothetical protein
MALDWIGRFRIARNCLLQKLPGLHCVGDLNLRTPGRAHLTAIAIAIAWDFSRTAARAVADAIPLLAQAKTVTTAGANNIPFVLIFF